MICLAFHRGPMDDGRLIPALRKGVGTLSTVHGNGYELMDGTSMACPAVAGRGTSRGTLPSAAWRSASNSSLVKSLLSPTRLTIRAAASTDYQYGYGVLNAPAALRARKQMVCAGRVERGVALAPVRIDVPKWRGNNSWSMLTWLDPCMRIRSLPAARGKALVNDSRPLGVAWRSRNFRTC